MPQLSVGRAGGGVFFFIFNLALSDFFHLGGLNPPITPIVGRQNFACVFSPIRDERSECHEYLTGIWGRGRFFLCVPFLQNKKNAFCVLTLRQNKLAQGFSLTNPTQHNNQESLLV